MPQKSGRPLFISLAVLYSPAMAKLPTSTDVSFSLSAKIPSKAGAVVVCLAEGQADFDALDLPEDHLDALRRLTGSGAFKGKPREVGFDLVPTGGDKYQRLIVVGLGKPAKATAETLREAGGAAARTVARTGVGHAAIVPPAVASLAPEQVADALVTGFALAAFDFREYQGTVKKAEDKPKDVSVSIVGGKGIKAAVDRAAAVAEAQNYARTIANRPGNDLNPPSLAKVAEELAKEAGLTCRVMDEKELKKLGMGGILAVGRGSAEPPRLIALEYDPAGKSKGKKKVKPRLAAVGGGQGDHVRHRRDQHQVRRQHGADDLRQERRHGGAGADGRPSPS